MNKVLLFLKDFTESGADRFFIYDESTLIERTALEISEINETIICHDYWLIAKSILKSAGHLPPNVVDIFEFSIAISGRRNKNPINKYDLLLLLSYQPNLKEEDVSKNEAEIRLVKNYNDVFYRKVNFDGDVYKGTACLLQKKWQEIKNNAIELNEMERQLDVEIPIFNLLHKHITPGIKINQDALRKHKKDIEHDYYTCLTNFSKKHDLPLEVPSDQTIREYLETKGFDFSDASLDYILKFTLIPNGFSEDVIRLRKIQGSRKLLTALPLGKNYSVPIIDTFGSITSRIYFKDPVFQNISKKHRDIIGVNSGKKLSYVDYDQFEVGIMAALSEDTYLKTLYNEDDLYAVLAQQIFGERLERKFSKKLFLSYAYGMKFKNIVDAAVAHGAEKTAVKDFFQQFSVFESWKNKIHKQFEETGAVSTIFGNFLRRESSGYLSEKEKRSCVSQLVQGTASYIFKKALLSIEKVGGFRIILPMHDAVLLEHNLDKDASEVVSIFCEVMTNELGGRISGKASLERFFDD